MSGHSKWAQIKHKKAITDAKRGQLFSKMVREIMVAARTGGPNPETNSRLRTALERARAGGLPKDNIERAIERASGEGEGLKLQELLYEATAPGGVYIIIEVITDNKNRTLAEIKHLLSENGGRLAESGSLIWNFDKIGTLEIAREENGARSREEIELAIIDSGAKNFVAEDSLWLVETDFSFRDKVRQELEAHGIKIKESGHDYKPRAFVDLSPESRESAEKLFELLGDHDDVQELYTNLQKL